MLQDSSLRYAAGQLYRRFTDSDQADRLERMTAQLDLKVLQPRVSEAMKQECKELHLFAAGANNVVYLALLEDNSDVLLRVMPEMQSEKFRLLGVLDEDVASHECEVATYGWVRTHTTIPVPKIYGSGTKPLPYIVMERAKGVWPYEVLEWDDGKHVESFVAQLADFERQLREAPFPAIGSLDATGTVGPMIQEPYTRYPPTNRGPFKSSKALALAYIDTAVEQLANEEVWMMRRQVAAGRRDTAERLPRAYMLTCLALLKEGVEGLPDEPESFRLIYYDMKPDNILLRGPDDPTITAVFDWQGARVAPAWATSGFHTRPLQWFVSPDEARDHALEAKFFPPAPEPFPWRELIGLLEKNPAYWLTKEELDDFVRGWKLPDEHAAGFLALQAFVGPA
ncbi:kinase-like domain-containing protein [Mycena amicta]|nr:kinase-like domain-containing protein [Mycena amicta]